MTLELLEQSLEEGHYVDDLLMQKTYTNTNDEGGMLYIAGGIY